MSMDSILQEELADPIRLKTILESTSDWIWELDKDANFTYASPRVKALLGYEPEELIGKSGYDLMPPDEADIISVKFNKYVEKQIPFNNLININLHKDGHRVILESSGVPFFNDNGDLVGYLGVDRDISDRYALERSLECSLELYRISDEKSISEVMQIGLDKAIELTESESGYFHFVDVEKNTVSLQVWSGETMKEFEIIKPNTEYPIEETGVWLDCYRQRKPIIHNDYNSLTHKKGLPEGHVNVERDVGIPVFEGEKVVAVLGVENKKTVYNEKDVEQINLIAENIWTVVRRKRAEKLLKETQFQLHESEKMRAVGQLAGGIAHDFNNQLSAIMGFADLIYDETLPGSDINNYAERILKSVSRSSDLTAKLLAFSRKGKYQSEAINVNEIIDETVHIIERSIDRKISIKKDIAKKDLFIEGDPHLIQNAILNMGINARDAINESGEIVFSSGVKHISNAMIQKKHLDIKNGKYAFIAVTDTGEGINDDVRNKIFEPFFTTKDVGKGIGMGLAAVFGTAKSHGGDVVVESEKGIGSKFEILLPICEENSEENRISTKEKIDEQAKKNILIAEDEEIVSMMFRNTFEREGYNVHIYENGKTALDFYKENWESIDLVILDFVMPIMNGKEAFMEMRSINPNIVALFVSGFSMNGEMKNVIDIGVKGFIQKPFRKNELLKVVSDIFA